MASPMKLDIMKRDLLGLQDILHEDEIGTKTYRKCAKCNRPTLGHARPGPGKNKCPEVEVVADDEAKEIFRGLYGAREAGKIKEAMEITQIFKLVHCEFCGVDFHYESDHKEHVAAIHTGYADLGCQECDIKFDDRAGLENHMRMNHFYTCVECGLFFHGKKVYKVHVKTCGVRGITEMEEK